VRERQDEIGSRPERFDRRKKKREDMGEGGREGGMEGGMIYQRTGSMQHPLLSLDHREKTNSKSTFTLLREYG